MGQLIVYSNEGGDGEVYASSGTWAGVQGATTGTAEVTATTGSIYSEDGFWMGRMFLPFNTADLPDGATITSAELRIWVTAKSDTDNDGDDFIRVVESTQADPTAIANGDFDALGTTAFATDIDIGDISTGAYLTFTLNSTGLAAISKTGYTKLALREGHDVLNHQIAASAQNLITMRTGNYTGTDYDPRLTVNYTETSASLSPSTSPSISPSVSPSISSSVSPSASLSPSLSPSVSPSISPSLSPSISSSVSPSASISPSISPSLSPSLSPSVSPSMALGYELYTRGDYNTLPADNADLETNYSAQNYLDVDEDDGTRVSQTATDEFAIHQFKDYVGANNSCTLTWNGQTDYPPNSSTVYLQIYNTNTTEWETVDSDNSSSADTDFTLTADMEDLTDYKDAEDLITCRVYQEGS